jgi:hypothetical protein
MALNGINLMCLYGFVVCTRVVFKLFIVIDDLVLLNARERFLHTSSVSHIFKQIFIKYIEHC